MSEKLPDPIASILEHPIDPERVEGWWSEISRRSATRSRTRVWPWMAAASAATAALMLVLMVRMPEIGPIALADGAPFPTEPIRASDGGRRMMLDDGTQIELLPRASITSLVNDGREVVLLLDEGTMVLDLSREAERRWTVESGLARVEPFGARVELRRNAVGLEIEVSRGTVLVTSERLPSRVRRLVGPARIEIAAEASRSTSQPVLEAPAQIVEPEPAIVPAPIAPAPIGLTPNDRAPPPARAQPQEERVPSPPAPIVDEAVSVDSVADPTPEVPAQLSDLLARSDGLRRIGRTHEAARLLEEAVENQPAAPLAAIAAFTLARVYQDLRDHPRAARALEMALERRLPEALEDDALAQLIATYEALGDVDAARGWTRIREARRSRTAP